jgi:sarcosine oxidase gamma subunit
MAILNNAQDSYHTEVTHAIMDAMLEHSGALAIGPDEWLTIAARGSQDRTQLAPAASDARTSVIRINGEVLRAFRAGQISKDDALKRIEVRVF